MTDCTVLVVTHRVTSLVVCGCVHDLIYLMGCATQRQAPDAERVRAMNGRAVFALAKRHKLAAMAAMALELVEGGPADVLGEELWSAWAELRDKAVRKSVLLDAERAAHLAFFEERGIWYVPLKGILLKDYYPRLGMREMADNDILYDVRFQQVVCEHMVVRGYEAKSVGRGVHDTYLKPPVYNFEFHTSLFSEALEDGRFAEHFAGVRERVVKDEGNAYGYHLSAGDLYVYVAAHAYKHHAGSGTGMRAVADNYAMRRALGSELRFAEIDRELGELGILGFDEALRSLGDRLLGKPADEWPELGEDEEELLARLAGAGPTATCALLLRTGSAGSRERVA